MNIIHTDKITLRIKIPEFYEKDIGSSINWFCDTFLNSLFAEIKANFAYQMLSHKMKDSKEVTFYITAVVD